MTELRFVSREGMYLTLESVTGERFQVLIDDALREAIRRGNQEVAAISPRVIQQRIREGASIAELATETGESEEHISVFALPVLDELRYVLATAQGIEVPDENRMVAFGILAEERLGPLDWAIRKTGQGWLITGNGQYGPANWRYEPKTRQLEPLNDVARAIQGGDSRDLIRATVPVPKPSASKPVSKPVVKPVTQRAAVPPISTEVEQEPVTGVSTEDKGASVLDLVEELRSRRAREQEAAETSEAAAAKSSPAAPAQKPSAKGRTSLPSWDEIVLGTATSEPDSD